MQRGLFGLAAFFLIGCSAAPRPLQSSANVSAAKDDVLVHLTRSGCFGACPAYDLTLHQSGNVDYIGYSHVLVQGRQHGTADPQALARLRPQLQRSAFSVLAHRYLHDSPACGLWASDMPTVTIEVFDNGRWLRAEHDYGCSAAPAALTQLEQAIDDAAQSSQWTSMRPRE